MGHPFGEEEAASLKSLRQFFGRCLQRGHWELARACLPQLHRGPDSGEVEKILRGLVTAPHLLRCDEEHTPQQVAWFWSDALDTWLQWDNKQPPKLLREETEFLLLLEELQDSVSEPALKELYEAFLLGRNESKETKKEISRLHLSPCTVASLCSILSRNPRLVQAVIGFLLMNDARPAAQYYNQHLLNITVNYVLHSLTEERTVPPVDDLYSILSTMHFNVDLQATELRHLCEELFKACWEKGTLSEEQVQAALLRRQNYALLGMYGSVTSEKIKADIIAHRTPEKGTTQELSDTERAIVALFCDPEQTSPWKKAFFYCLSAGKHFLEQILVTALTLLKRDDFSSLDLLLSDNFKPLRRLLVLLGWTHLQSTESAKSLLYIMHKNKDLYNDSVLKQFCDGLLFQVEVLEWCIEHSSHDIPKKDIMRHLSSLDNHSALYILHHLTNLPELNEDQVLALLQRPLSGDVSVNHQDSHEQIQRRNTVVFKAFCAMKYSIYALCINAHKHVQCKQCHHPAQHNGSLDDTPSPGRDHCSSQDYSAIFVQCITKCQYYLGLLPSALRLEVLENIFSLLFVSLTDLNSSPLLPEDYTMEEGEEESDFKVGSVRSLDSSNDKDSLLLSPFESPQHDTSNLSTADLVGFSQGSTPPTSQKPPSNLWEMKSNYLDLKHFTSGLSGFLVDEVVLDTFLKMLKEQVELVKDSLQVNGCDLSSEQKPYPTLNTSITDEAFNTRAVQLSKYISEAQWRYKVVMSNRIAEEELVSARLQSRPFKVSSFKRRRRTRGSGSKKLRESNSSELSTSGSSASNLSIRCDMEGRNQTQQRNTLIPMLLSAPEHLLISCILRGNYAEAHEVSRMFSLQSSPSYGELIFMERYQEVIRELSKVEKKIENQNPEVGSKQVSSSRSTLQAIGNAAAAGMVFYSISDVTDRLVVPAETPIPALQDDFWLKSARLEKTDPWRHVVEEMSPAAMAAFDLACTQAHLWKTCKQLLETTERRLHNCLEIKRRDTDEVMAHPEGITGFQAAVQQMSKIINYPSPTAGQTELEEKINGQFKCSMTDLLHTCYPVMRDEHIIRQITLTHELEQIVIQLKSAINASEPKGNLIQSLMDQLSAKPQDVQMNPVRKQMNLLLSNLEERAQCLDNQSFTFALVQRFLTYMDTLAKTVVQSINSELDSSSEVKVGNPFILLQQKPSQLISHLLFDRQVPPERLSTLLKRENLDLNVEQIIVDCCCEPLFFCNALKENEMQSLLSRIQQSVQQCLDASFPNDTPPVSLYVPECEDSTPKKPNTTVADSTQYSLTASALNFLKNKSTLAATVSCLSATKSLKPTKSGLSWMELRGNKKESPLEMDVIAKESDALLEEFPALQRFIDLMSTPFLDGVQESNGSCSGVCGKPCAAVVLLGLHSSSATGVITEALQNAISRKDWNNAFKLINLYTGGMNDLEKVMDALLCCAAASEENEGWRYVFAVKDPTLRSQVVLHFLEKWPLDSCMEILLYCVCEADIDDLLKLELQTKRKELDVYQKILSLKEDLPWGSWQALKEDCSKDPQAVINVILEAKDYTLCEAWEFFYPIPKDLLISLHCEHLIHLLENKDTDRSLQLLKRVEDHNLRLMITEQALLQNPSIFASHFLAEYLLNHFHSSLPESRCDEIRNIYMGSKTLLALPESAHPNYEHLLSSPLLLLEQLLMNMKIDWASLAVQTLQLIILPESTFSVEDVDNLLCTYAGKALDIPFSFRDERTDATSRFPEPSNQSAEPELATTPSTADPGSSPFTERSLFQTPLSTPNKGHRRNRSSPEFVPPEKPPAKTQWTPDDTEVTCMVCKNEQFTMFNRRHHCRRCGRLVCSSCSMKKMVVEGCRENPARVCDQCHNYFFSNINKTEDDLEQVEEKPEGSLNLSEVLRLSKAADLQWWLTLNEAENEVERREFYYEQAPSASLCTAILNLHSKSEECGYQLIERCCLLSKGLTNPEMDSRLLLDIMKSLLFSAKMIFVKAARSHDLAQCDSYSSKVDLLKILVAASYQDIPSLDEMVRPAAVVRLRNQLLEAEYYNLAIEVSTKTGLDPSGVWHAWGMACLKSDNLTGAREKFSRCIKAPLDLNQKNTGSKLLEDVVQHLESAAKPILLVKDDEYFATLKELEATLKARCIWYEMMPEGKFQNNTYYQECLYYLHTYGTNLAIIQFYMRHDLMRDALLHLLHKECPGDIFIEGIFVPSYESGKLQTLEAMLESIDSSLESWSVYLINACKHLQEKNYYNILYELQQFMKDHVRAAMTCIHFFSHKAKTYRDLGDNQKWLVKSKEHLKIYLQEVSHSKRRKSFDTFRKKMSASDISRHINTVELQMEITKFLQRCESLETALVYNKPPPTLFGHGAMMVDVACRVILGGKNVEEGFGIAFRVIQDFQLDASTVYSTVCKHLVQQENYSEILQLVKCVSESGVSAEKDCDQILLRCVEDMADLSSDELEILIQGIRSDEMKIKAFLACRMMRSAYLTAVKQEHERAYNLVQEVWQAARNINDGVVQGICSKWLLEHPPASKDGQRQPSRK